MILPIAVEANWDLIKHRKQQEINWNDQRENRDRIPHDYKVGDKAYLREEGIRQKLSSPRDGPFEITDVHNNGTVEIQQGAVSERVNMRRVSPHFSRE